MKLYVEASEGEEEGALTYEALTEEVIADLGVARMIDEVRIYVDVERMLFYIKVRKNPTAETIEVKEVVELTEKGTALEMTITNEVYAPYLLDMLWDRFGEENVNQIRRNFLEIINARKEDIFRLPLAQIKEKEKDALIRDMILRIIPIGFRIIKKMPSPNNDNLTICYLASENPITEEEIKEVEKRITMPPKPLRITREEVIEERKPKKMFVPYKEFYA
jgi:putative methanogenesis marker protein 17